MSDLYVRSAVSEEPLQLSQLCCDYFGGKVPEKQRRVEWPFCSLEASQSLAANIAFVETVQSEFPVAWSVFVEDDPSVLVGILTVSNFDEEHHCLQLGTYIAPQFRGRGLQRLAKEALFKQLPDSIFRSYCLIETWNAASLKAISKLPYGRLIPNRLWRTLAPKIREELWKKGSGLHVFELDVLKAIQHKAE